MRSRIPAYSFPYVCNIQVSVLFQGYDEKKVTWQDNMGALVRNGEHMQVTRDGDLEVKDVSWGDMGLFSCCLLYTSDAADE